MNIDIAQHWLLGMVRALDPYLLHERTDLAAQLRQVILDAHQEVARTLPLRRQQLIEMPGDWMREHLAHVCMTVGSVSAMLIVKESPLGDYRLPVCYKPHHPRDAMAGSVIPHGSGITSDAWATWTPQLIRDVERDRRHTDFPGAAAFCPLYGGPTPGRYEDMMIVPFRMGDTDCLLQVMNHGPARDKFNAQDLQVLELLTGEFRHQYERSIHETKIIQPYGSPVGETGEREDPHQLLLPTAQITRGATAKEDTIR